MKNLVSATFYGYFNYVIAIVTGASPWIFGFDHVGGASLFIPIFVGWMQLIMAIFSMNKAGFMKVFQNQFHMVLDALSGFVLLVSPFLYGFCDKVMWPHIILGGIILLLSIVTKGSPLTNLASPHLREGNLGSVAATNGRLDH